MPVADGIGPKSHRTARGDERTARLDGVDFRLYGRSKTAADSRKYLMKWAAGWGMFALAGAGTSSGAQVAPPSPVPTESQGSMLPPTAAEEQLALADRRNWQAFLSLAAKPNGLVTPHDLRKAFGRQLNYDAKSRGYWVPYTFRYGPADTPKLHELYPGRRAAWATLSLRENKPSRCIARDEIRESLIKEDWIPIDSYPASTLIGPEGVRVPLPARDDFLKGDQGTLRVTYENGCPKDSFLISDRLEFDETQKQGNHNR